MRVKWVSRGTVENLPSHLISWHVNEPLQLNPEGGQAAPKCKIWKHCESIYCIFINIFIYRLKPHRRAPLLPWHAPSLWTHTVLTTAQRFFLFVEIDRLFIQLFSVSPYVVRIHSFKTVYNRWYDSTEVPFVTQAHFWSTNFWGQKNDNVTRKLASSEGTLASCGKR